MAWWKRPNTSVSNMAEAAAAGLPFLEAPETTTNPVASVIEVSSQTNSLIDLWKTATNDKMACGHFTQINEKMHFTKDVASTCQFWSEGVLSIGIAAFGLIGNLISIWVLSVPEMRSTAFNRLLLALALVDCLFIGPGILIYVFEAFDLEADWYNYLFPVVFYPCSEIALCSSIYMTVAIAVERFIGLCRPFRRLSSRPCPAKAYILPVLGISVLINIPKFLESETVVTYDHLDNNITHTRVGVTSMRTHPNYITYYTMWTRLLATGIFPLAMLAILNTKIYLALRRSKAQLRSMAIRAALPMAILGKPATPPNCQMADLRIDSNWSRQQQQNGRSNGPSSGGGARGGAPKSPRPALPHPMNRSATAAAVMESSPRSAPREPIHRSQSTAAATPLTASNGHQQQQAPQQNDLSLAPVLFGVVIVFVFCNTLRVFLNMYDFSVVDQIIGCEKKGVGRMPPAWIVCTVSISHMLLMINSSVNFLVYCVAGSKFRTILYQQLSALFKRWRPNSNNNAGNGAPNGRANNGGGAGIETALLQNGSNKHTFRSRNRNRLLELKHQANNIQDVRIVEV